MCEPLLKKFLTQNNFILYGNKCNNIMRNYFSYYTNDFKKINEKGYDFFKQYIDISPQTTFNSAKAFYLYFAFQLNKNDSKLQEILNQIIVTSSFHSFEEYRDFSLFCLYKGMFHLKYKHYIKASFSFLMALNKIGNTISNCHIDCYKRLLLLKHIVDDEFVELIDRCIKQASVINNCDGVDQFLYLNIKRLEELIKQKQTLAQDKLTGLAYVALFSLLNKKITSYLRRYRRISLKQLSKLTEIKGENILVVLQKNVAKGKMNVKYDEVSDIIEVIQCDIGNKSIDEVKDMYREMIMLTNNLVTFDDNILFKQNVLSSLTPTEMKEYLNLVENNCNEFDEYINNNYDSMQIDG